MVLGYSYPVLNLHTDENESKGSIKGTKGSRDHNILTIERSGRDAHSATFDRTGVDEAWRIGLIGLPPTRSGNPTIARDVAVTAAHHGSLCSRNENTQRPSDARFAFGSRH
jgi:hypothetical protein